jgi:hypothetical protein
MAGAHLMACDRSTKDELCFSSDDCDGKVVILASSFLSVGLHAMIVGHAYNSAKNISHVLTAVRVDGKWMYADPTPEDFKLGECVDFSRERILSVPNVQVLCDGDTCLSDKSNYDPGASNFVTEGVFVGVDGTPRFAWLRRPSTLGQEQQGEQISIESVVKRCTAGRGTTKEDLKGAAGCAADVFCATYGVPPGACGGVVEFVLDVIDEVFSATPGPGFEGVVARTMYLHNKLFPREPRWQWEKVGPTQGIRLAFGPQGDGYYLPNLPTRQAYAAAIPPYTFDFFKNLDPAKPYSGAYTGADLSRLGTASLQVQAKLSVRSTEERARGTKKSNAMPILAAGAAGAAVWYFWSDIARFFR